MFNQLTLYNDLNGCEDLGTLELRAAVASLKNEHHDDAVFSLLIRLESYLGYWMAEAYRL